VPQWTATQTSFSAGEISPRMLSRVDTDIYRQAALRMLNFMPRVQGPATRAPSPWFINDITAGGLEGRMVPFIALDNTRTVLILQDQSLRLLNDIQEPAARSTGTNLVQQIVGNPDFDAPLDAKGSWDFEPAFFYGGENDGLGCRYVTLGYGSVLQCICRLWKYRPYDNETFTVRQTITVPYPSDTATLDYSINYPKNPGLNGEAFDFRISIGTTPGANNLYAETLSGPIGTLFTKTTAFELPTPGFTGDIYATFFCEATENESTPVFEFDRFAVFTAAPPIPATPDIDTSNGVLYDGADLADIQYVQSPYGRNEVVIVHPKYPPQWFYYDTALGKYILETMTFNEQPVEWVSGNYPSVCTSYQGRLILGATPQQSQTIWGSRPGLWEDFNPLAGDNEGTPVSSPDSAIEFTSIYRSGIKWVYGQKDLLIGAGEFEYVATAADGLLIPGDIDVRLHGTNGSTGVQPAGFGKFVVFAAERGTRVRAAQLSNDDEGWISPDLTVVADHLTNSGVTRMARLRNPHQMLACALATGDVAVLHQDEYADVFGWSLLSMGGDVVDLCALSIEDGTDVLFILIKRMINGSPRLYVEGIFNWTYDREWRYQNSNIRLVYGAATNVLTGLEHLEGARVQVIGDRAYLGTFRVTNGQVTLQDGNGLPYRVFSVLVGMAAPNLLQLLPPVTGETTGGVSAFKRYTKIIVRTLGSTRPVINDQRPPARDPLSPMNSSQPLDLARDNEVANLGTDRAALISIYEDTPFRCEVISVSGQLTSNKP